ncbi:MAG: tRNA (N(6)-L-threonylcarbamoyladenosine(37)-C(2))-methylthiotransferase MtaB [Dictyoglomi bacterium]|nr:tRNA (N(6)-L-threonylcarbamoyladenosine(37)-C(2))-methylthiotransferase MtaB [Dictyoglomota bacterium]
MKFRIYTFGCKTNQYDSEFLRRNFLQLMKEADSDEKPDLIVVNTCSVTHIAERKARTLIRHLLKTYPEAKIIVTGCYAERSPDELERLGDIRVIGNMDKDKILDLFSINSSILSPDAGRGRKVRAFVKIQDGCDDFCSYCIVPYVRGPVRSRSFEEIIGEIEQLVKFGYLEIVLIGIHIGKFESDGKSLPDLVRTISDNFPEIRRIRLSSLEPQEVNRDIIDLFKDVSNLCPHIHLVAQSGSNKVLRDMKRKYTREEFLSIIDDFRSVMKNIEFTTDIIVGFPTEEEEDFRDTISLIEEVGFVKVHIFPFSPRPGTEAFDLTPLDKKIVKEREELLKAVSLETAFNKLNKLVGNYVEILVERYSDGMAAGLTPNYVRVYLNTIEPLKPGEIIKVKVNGVEKAKDSVVLRGVY